MTKPLANPTPLAQRGQGPKRRYGVHRLSLPIGATVCLVTRSNLGWVTSTQDAAQVMAPDGLALLRLRLPDGSQVELYRPADPFGGE